LRLGLVLSEGQEALMARAAEEHGLFGVLAGTGDPRTATTAAVYASTATQHVRVIVRVQVGLEHPVTIAEEVSVLDNVNNGRTVVLADTGGLSVADAAEEIAVLREALGNRPLHHEGVRWKVPAGLPANATAPRAIAVTPKPAQIEIPFWVTGRVARDVGRQAGLPLLASEVASDLGRGPVEPAIASIQGNVDRDREAVSAWASAGATHLLLELPRDARLAAVMTMISRYLAPEVGMPHFPRVMSDSKVPLPWPGDGRG
jgi:alkanesulfonate monooxygenase SsuD/methylene tetrahydromethanopterin reductase-like flavin-dependent oxidoreductase (luciferase family)